MNVMLAEFCGGEEEEDGGIPKFTSMRLRSAARACRAEVVGDG